MLFYMEIHCTFQQRAVPASIFTPMKRNCKYYAFSPIALFRIMCYNKKKTVRTDSEQKG